MTGLLDGVRILAVEQFGAGPYGTLHLADLGAEIIKIENPHDGGDIARSVPPFTGNQDSLYFQSFNRNKKSITLDLKHPQGQEIFHRLVQNADAVFSSLRGDQPAKLGLTYEHLKPVNSAIVCCALTGFGLDGPRAAEPAYDYLMQAYAGWMSLTGEPGAPPAKSGLSVVDFSAGLAAMMGLLAGVLNARDTGEGCDVDVSLLDTAIGMLSYLAIWTLNRDYQPERMANSAHPSLVPSQVFQTADGWLVVFCAKEKFWVELANAMDAKTLLDDPRYANFSDRLNHREQLVSELKPLFQERTTSDWLERLRGVVPCAPVNDVNAALEDEQVRARNMIIEVDHPEFGRLRETASSVKTTDQRRAHQPGPALGADTRSVLQDIAGYSPEDVRQFQQRNII